jgi:hypothetical protein
LSSRAQPRDLQFCGPFLEIRLCTRFLNQTSSEMLYDDSIFV